MIGRSLIAALSMSAMSAGPAFATEFDDLFTNKAPAIGVGALALQILLTARPEVKTGQIEPPLVIISKEQPAAAAEPINPKRDVGGVNIPSPAEAQVIWVAAWYGTGGGETPASRCRSVLQNLRHMLGSDGSGQVTRLLQDNMNSLVLAATGLPASDDLAAGLAKVVRIRGLVHLADSIGVCEGTATKSDISLRPGSDPGWDRVSAP